MPHRETTIEAWTLPNLGSTFERKFALTPYVSNRSFTIDYSAGGGGSLGLAREFAKFSQFVHVDQTNHANDVGSIVRVNKDGTPVAHYLARRFEDNIDPAATVLPVVLQSLNFFLDTAGVAPYDHDPLDDANSPNPTLDPDWEYGAESILRVLGNEFANEVQRIWRGSTVTMGDFKLTDGTDTTDAIDWDASSSVLRTRLETDIASITNVIVRGDGSLKTPWEVEFTDPAGDIGYTLAVTANTTDGVFSTDTVRNGGTLDPSPWHRSYNAVTKTEHGNYQAFEVLHRDNVPVGLQAASTDEYFLRVNLDDVNDPEDYGGAQVIANVDPGSVYRASVPVWADGAGYDFRLVLRHLDEAHIANGGDIPVPADTLTTLNINPFKFGDNTNEIIYRVGILETTNIGDVYIAFQSAILAPGFDEEPLGKIMNDLLVPINARGLLTWVTPTWTDALDSAGNAWDQKLQWTISHRQSLLQLVEFAREWGYESTGIYWSEANSRFEWGLFNPGGGGTVITDETIVIGDTEGSGPVLHRLPGATAAWAFGRNGAWGRYEDTDLVTALGRLEVMDLDRQSRDNLTVHAMERIEAEKESATGQRLRLRTDRFTAFIDMSPGDFVEVNLGPRFINDVYRIAGITDAVDEEGNEYQEFHIGTLVKDAATAETDTVRELYRKFQSFEGDRDRGGVVDPSQQVIPTDKSRPIIVAAFNAPDDWKAVASYQCLGSAANPIDGETIQRAIDEADDTGTPAQCSILFSPGDFFLNTDTGSGINVNKNNGAILAGSGIDSTYLHGVVPTDAGPDRYVIDCGSSVTIRDMAVADFTNPSTVTVYGINVGDYGLVENVYGYGTGWLIAGFDGPYSLSILACMAEYNGGLARFSGVTSLCTIANCTSSKSDDDDLGNIQIAGSFTGNTIVGNVLSGTGDMWAVGVTLANGSVVQNVIANNVMYGGANSGFGGIQIVFAGSGFFTDNTIIGNFVNGDTGLSAVRSGGTGDWLRSSVIANVFSTASATDVACVHFDDVDVDTLMIHNNVIQGGGNYGVYVDANTRTMRRISIRDNTFSAGIDVSAVYVAATSTGTVEGVTVAGNRIRGSAIHAIELDGAGIVSVSGNAVEGDTASGGVSLTDCTDVVVRNNHLTDPVEGIVLAGTQDFLVVADNYVRMAHPPAAASAIEIAGTYTRGKVQGNTLIPSATVTNLEYGINPSSAAGSALLVVGNDYRGTWGTAGLNVTNSPIVTWSGGGNGENRA